MRYLGGLDNEIRIYSAEQFWRRKSTRRHCVRGRR